MSNALKAKKKRKIMKNPINMSEVMKE